MLAPCHLAPVSRLDRGKYAVQSDGGSSNHCVMAGIYQQIYVSRYKKERSYGRYMIPPVTRADCRAFTLLPDGGVDDTRSTNHCFAPTIVFGGLSWSFHQVGQPLCWANHCFGRCLGVSKGPILLRSFLSRAATNPPKTSGMVCCIHG